MHRFLVENAGEKVLHISSIELLHQMLKVFRSKLGDTFIFFSGQDENDYMYILESKAKKEVIFTLQKNIEKQKKSKHISLFQALPSKTEKIEYIIQKGVEVGIEKFYFFPSQYSQKLFLSENKIQRFHKIAYEALEQSGQNIIPRLYFFSHIKETFSEMNPSSQKIFFHHIQDSQSFFLKNIEFSRDISYFVGPEGGWSDEEVVNFQNKNFQKVYFTGSILRCETVSSVVGFYMMQQ